MKNGQNYFPFKIIFLLIVLGIALALFNHSEPGGESWYYWTFARVFSQTGTFIVPDRSPVFVLYLSFFRGLGYPGAMIAECFVSTLIAAMALVVLFRRYLPWAWLTLAVILWIPYLQTAEPPVSKLALACVCFAAVLREAHPSRFRHSLSYALLILAGMFRGTYIICFGVFLIWDLWGIIKKKMSARQLLPTRYDWPIFIVIALMIWFQTAQSPQRWNNAFGSSIQWVPANPKSLLDDAFIGNCNIEYIKRAYGSFVEKDWYFTNREIFGGAKTMLGAIRANPKFVLKQTLINVKYDIIMASKMTLVPDLFDQKLPQGSPWWYPIHLFITLPILGFVLYGAFRGWQTDAMRCFFAANVLMLGSLAVIILRERYMHPMIPIALLSASWYVTQVKFSGRIRHWLIFLIIMLFSAGVLHWLKIAADVAKDISQGTLSLMRARPYSMTSAKPQVEPLIKNCRGVLSFDHKFWAAFSHKPLDQFYDIYEIPPFGSLGHSSYDGLRPGRIDCIILSDSVMMADNFASESNARMRYEHYIKPYVEKLKSLGAKTYQIPSYGTVTVLGQ